MRILYVSDVYFPRVNGVSTSIRTFRRELAALGHEVTLVAPEYPQAARADEAGILRMASRRVPFDPEDRLMQSAALRRLPAYLAPRTFDLVHIQTPFAAHYAGIALARQLNVPCVTTYHTFFEEYLHHYVPFAPRYVTRIAARLLSRRQCNAVDAVIVPSRAMLTTLRIYGVETRITILPTGIPVGELQGGDGAAFKQRHGIPAERRVLLHVGRVAYEKNIDFLVHTFARIHKRDPRTVLVIAGEGPALPALRRLAGRLKLDAHIHFVGYLERTRELLDCYRAAEVFMFASRTETQGLVLLEAMIQGVPVVSIAEMGTVDILEDGQGALIAPQDEDAFADQVCRILDSEALRSRLARTARHHALQWESRQLAQRLAEVYAAAIASGARASRMPPIAPVEYRRPS